MSHSQIGLIGLGTMGAMLALNIAEKGFDIAVFNRTTSVTKTFHENAGALASKITPCETIEALVHAIAKPRAIILMVPAGDPVDQQIAALRDYLDPDDLIIDAGNANFHDTDRRAAEAAKAGPRFLGIGVSGGEEGARNGPAIMGGGEQQDWDRVAPVLTAIAAKFDGTPCAGFMGKGGSGHFVKAVHNGIEYADMEMIAEIYGVMRDGMKMSAQACGDAFAKWDDGPLKSYLIEISGKVARTADPDSGKPMLDIILDRAGQKGTGRWTVIEAQHLAAPVPVIEAAVMARNLSARLEARKEGQDLFGAAPEALPEGTLSADDLEHALIAGKILCYAQGFEMLRSANAPFDWDLPLPEIALIWRDGCIIRSAMLDDMARALTDAPERNLMYAPYFAALLKTHHAALRKVVGVAARYGLAVPALSMALSYFDTMRTERGTANMIQGQRDFFGAHGFERTDRDGTDFHGPWAM